MGGLYGLAPSGLRALSKTDLLANVSAGSIAIANQSASGISHFFDIVVVPAAARMLQ